MKILYKIVTMYDNSQTSLEHELNKWGEKGFKLINYVVLKDKIMYVMEKKNLNFSEKYFVDEDIDWINKAESGYNSLTEGQTK